MSERPFKGEEPGAIRVRAAFVDQVGELLFQEVEQDGKRWVRRPNGTGGWISNAEGVPRALWNLPTLSRHLAAGRHAGPVYLTEGPSDAQALVDYLEREGRSGVVTTNPFGALAWLEDYTVTLTGTAALVAIVDHDEAGRKRAALLKRELGPVVEELHILRTPLEHKGADLRDHLAAGLSLDELIPAEFEESARRSWLASEDTGPATTIARVLELARAYLDVGVGEERYIIGALCAAVASELTSEEPLWLMIVGAPGGGKTEAIRLLDDVVDRRVDELTRAGLLSWSVGKNAKPSGLLVRLPRDALVAVSDFSTIVTTGDREARARMFAALRVVYDGSIYRSIGGEPASEGKAAELAWEGHLTLVAAATSAIDTHTSFEGTLGERWIIVRLPESSRARARARARYVASRRDVPELRAAARSEAGRLVLAARRRIPRRLSEATTELLADISTFAATVRTGVPFEGQGKSRVVSAVPTPEEPTRLMGQLLRLARCAVALGLEEETAAAFAASCAIDSVPLTRWRTLRAVAGAETVARVADVWRALGRGNWWAAKWELDALEALGLVEVIGPDESARAWRLSDEWRGSYESVVRSLSPSLSNEVEA